MASAAESNSVDSASFGRVFERAWSTCRHNPGLILGLALLFGAFPTILLTYVWEETALALVGSIDNPSPDALPTYIGLFLAYLLATLVVSSMSQAVMTPAVVAESEGRLAGFGEALSSGLLVFVPLIAIAIVGGIGVTLGLTLFVIPGIIIWTAWAVSVPVLVAERRGVLGSLGRSSELTIGYRWKVLGVFLVLLVANWLIVAAVGAFALADSAGRMTISLALVSMVTGTIANAMWATVHASLYVELRDWKDGPASERLEQIFA